MKVDLDKFAEVENTNSARFNIGGVFTRTRPEVARGIWLEERGVGARGSFTCSAESA